MRCLKCHWNGRWFLITTVNTLSVFGLGTLNGLIAVIKTSIKLAKIHVTKGPLRTSTETYTQREQLTAVVFSSALIPLKCSFCVNRTVLGTLRLYHPSPLPPFIWPILPSPSLHTPLLWVFLYLTTFSTSCFLQHLTINAQQLVPLIWPAIHSCIFFLSPVDHIITIEYVHIFQKLQIFTVASGLWWTCILTIYPAVIPKTNAVIVECVKRRK